MGAAGRCAHRPVRADRRRGAHPVRGRRPVGRGQPRAQGSPAQARARPARAIPVQCRGGGRLHCRRPGILGQHGPALAYACAVGRIAAGDRGRGAGATGLHRARRRHQHPYGPSAGPGREGWHLVSARRHPRRPTHVPGRRGQLRRADRSSGAPTGGLGLGAGLGAGRRGRGRAALPGEGAGGRTPRWSMSCAGCSTRRRQSGRRVTTVGSRSWWRDPAWTSLLGGWPVSAQLCWFWTRLRPASRWPRSAENWWRRTPESPSGTGPPRPSFLPSPLPFRRKLWDRIGPSARHPVPKLAGGPAGAKLIPIEGGPG